MKKSLIEGKGKMNMKGKTTRLRGPTLIGTPIGTSCW